MYCLLMHAYDKVISRRRPCTHKSDCAGVECDCRFRYTLLRMVCQLQLLLNYQDNTSGWCTASCSSEAHSIVPYGNTLHTESFSTRGIHPQTLHAAAHLCPDTYHSELPEEAWPRRHFFLFRGALLLNWMAGNVVCRVSGRGET